MDYPDSLQPIPQRAKKVFSGVIFSIWQWEQKMFDGSTQIFEKAQRNPSVGVLPVTRDKKIIITTQKQPSMKQFSSLVGGIVDKGEKPEAAAKRELLEEVGMQCEQLELWYGIQPVTKVEWPIYLYIARNAEVIAEPNLDPGEKIKSQAVSWDEFLEITKSSDFRDTEVALRILQASQNKSELEKIKEFILSGN